MTVLSFGNDRFVIPGMSFLSLRGVLLFLCHCEERSDEAIQRRNVHALDCFATLAMTGDDFVFCNDDVRKIAASSAAMTDGGGNESHASACLPSFALQNSRFIDCFVASLLEWVVRFAYLPSFALQNLQRWLKRMDCHDFLARSLPILLSLPSVTRQSLYTIWQ